MRALIWDREELAWAAGFFDGEGHVGLASPKQSRKYVHLQICQTEAGPLEKFSRILGVGKIMGPYLTKVKNFQRRPYTKIGLSKFEEVQHVICLLWPWLSAPKRQQAKKALTSFLVYNQSCPRLRPGPKLKDRRVPTCHPELEHHAKGLCERCYRKTKYWGLRSE